MYMFYVVYSMVLMFLLSISLVIVLRIIYLFVVYQV